MERPLDVPPLTPMLPSQFRFMLERINLFAESENEMATILFDGDGKSQYGGLAVKFSNYLHRSVEGRSYSRITDSPFFVDSKITAGFQIADMAAGVVRIYEENGLFRGPVAGDSFLSAVRRYYGVVEGKTVNHMSPSGFPRHGFYRMPEREHYATVTEDRAEEGNCRKAKEPGVTPAGNHVWLFIYINATAVEYQASYWEMARGCHHLPSPFVPAPLH